MAVRLPGPPHLSNAAGEVYGRRDNTYSLPGYRHMVAARAIVETGRDPAHYATMHRVKRVSVCTFRVDTPAFTN